MRVHREVTLVEEVLQRRYHCAGVTGIRRDDVKERQKVGCRDRTIYIVLSAERGVIAEALASYDQEIYIYITVNLNYPCIFFLTSLV